MTTPTKLETADEALDEILRTLHQASHHDIDLDNLQMDDWESLLDDPDFDWDTLKEEEMPPILARWDDLTNVADEELTLTELGKRVRKYGLSKNRNKT